MTQAFKAEADHVRKIIKAADEEKSVLDDGVIDLIADLDFPMIAAVLDLHQELVSALETSAYLLGRVEDFGTATGLNPDAQNNALDASKKILEKAKEILT